MEKNFGFQKKVPIFVETIRNYEYQEYTRKINGINSNYVG
jgi:hypothetical protein